MLQVMFIVFYFVSVCLCVLREMLMQMMCDTKPFVCFKAKDLLRTALKHFSKDLSWKQGGTHIKFFFLFIYLFFISDLKWLPFILIHINLYSINLHSKSNVPAYVEAHKMLLKS